MVDLKTFQKLPFLMTVVEASVLVGRTIHIKGLSRMQCLRYILIAKSFFCLDHENLAKSNVKKKNEQRSCLNLAKLSLEAVGNGVIDRLIMFFFTVVFSLAFHSVITFIEQQYGHFRLGFAMYSYTASLCK